MSLPLAHKGDDLLYRYICPEDFQRRVGFYHKDPLICEFTYGEAPTTARILRNRIGVGSRVFFHTTKGGIRYLTAMYWASDLAPAAEWRLDPDKKRQYQNPHLHPENWPGWDTDRYRDQDVILVGDRSKSLDLTIKPLVLSREILDKLESLKPINWDSVGSCLRSPRVLSNADGDFLEELGRRQAEAIAAEPDLSSFVPVADPVVASHMATKCETEQEIESYIVDKLDKLEAGLQLVDRQVRLEDGNRIDVLARRPEGTPVVIEIKRGTADDSTLTQLLSYLRQFQKQFVGPAPIGKIVCADASYRLKSACEHLHGQLQIHFYGDILLRSE